MFKKFTWAHGVAVALGAFIAFILFMILVFPNGQQNAELVSKDYYADELQYQQVIDAKNNADHLPEKPRYLQNAAGISLTFPESLVPDASRINFELFRTNDANLDVHKELTLDAHRTAFIPAKILAKGSYTLKVRWQYHNKPHQLDYDIEWK